MEGMLVCREGASGHGALSGSSGLTAGRGSLISTSRTAPKLSRWSPRNALNFSFNEVFCQQRHLFLGMNTGTVHFDLLVLNGGKRVESAV